MKKHKLTVRQREVLGLLAKKGAYIKDYKWLYDGGVCSRCKQITCSSVNERTYWALREKGLIYWSGIVKTTITAAGRQALNEQT